jgi:hypothetical protein
MENRYAIKVVIFVDPTVVLERATSSRAFWVHPRRLLCIPVPEDAPLIRGKLVTRIAGSAARYGVAEATWTVPVTSLPNRCSRE